jgi:hypothetical protein
VSTDFATQLRAPSQALITFTIYHRWFREDLFARFTAIASQGHGFQAPALPNMSHGPAALSQHNAFACNSSNQEHRNFSK